jgi:hypothetical protein
MEYAKIFEKSSKWLDKAQDMGYIEIVCQDVALLIEPAWN